MSDVPTNKPVPVAKATSPARLIVLLSIFGIALAGLLYDYAVARPGIKAAYDKVENMLEGGNRGDMSVSPEDVQKEMGREPSEVQDLENGKIEIYTWRSGMPTRKYSLYVVYTGRKLPLLYSATQNVPPEGSELPPKNTMTEAARPEGLAEDARPMQAAVTAGGNGKRGGKKKKNDDAAKGEEAKGEEAKSEETKKDEADTSGAAAEGSGTAKNGDST